MESSSTDIPELLIWDDIDRVEEEYAKQFGHRTFNVSHWDSMRSFTDRIQVALPLSQSHNVLDYQYSYHLDHRDALIARLGFSNGHHACLVTPSGTSAIVCLLNFLRARQVSMVYATSPVYFPVVHNARAYGVAFEHAPMLRQAAGFCLSPALQSLQACEKKVIWITNPVYCTGAYLGNDEVEFLRQFMERGGMVVADEALAIPGREICRVLGGHENFVGLYTPHKAICVNGVKFGAIVAHRRFLHHFEHWADVLIGGIGIGAVIAIEHFLSPGFDHYLNEFLSETREVKRVVAEAISPFTSLELDNGTDGHFISVYATRLESFLSIEQYRQIAWDSGASFIPGFRNHFGSAIPFSWRVNLARDGAQFRAAFRRMASVIDKMSRS